MGKEYLKQLEFLAVCRGSPTSIGRYVGDKMCQAAVERTSVLRLLILRLLKAGYSEGVAGVFLECIMVLALKEGWAGLAKLGSRWSKTMNALPRLKSLS